MKTGTSPEPGHCHARPANRTDAARRQALFRAVLGLASQSLVSVECDQHHRGFVVLAGEPGWLFFARLVLPLRSRPGTAPVLVLPSRGLGLRSRMWPNAPDADRGPPSTRRPSGKHGRRVTRPLCRALPVHRSDTACGGRHRAGHGAPARKVGQGTGRPAAAGIDSTPQQRGYRTWAKVRLCKSATAGESLPTSPSSTKQPPQKAKPTGHRHNA